MKNILLIDAFGIIFKFYYVLNLKNSKGENTSAIYGFFSTLLSLLSKESPDYYLVALEGGGKCFRNEIYPEYKANRPPPPEDLVYQIPKIIEILEKLGIPHLYKEGYEADDIIGTIAQKFTIEGDNKALILSSDKDLRQLINDKIIVYNPSKNSNEFIEMDESYIKEKMGIKPIQIIDYLSLRGDSSDNIPGVAGIGEKYATELLKQFETVEKIYENIDTVSKKLKDKLVLDKDKAFLSKKLATIDKNVVLDVNLDFLKTKQLDIDSAMDILQNENLKSIIVKIKEYNNKFLLGNSQKKIESTKPQTDIISSKIEYKLISNIEQLQNKINLILQKKCFSFDIETTGFDFLKDKIITISISDGEEGFVIPLYISENQQLESNIKIDDSFINRVRKELKIIFENNNILKIGHNIKFDLKFLKNFNIELSSNYFDTMLAQYCLDASGSSFGLKELVYKYFGYTPINYSDVVPDTKKNTLLDVEISKLVDYSGQDAFISYKLFTYLKNELEKNKKAEMLFYEIEMPVSIVLTEMEYNGVSIDKKYLQDLSEMLDEDIKSLVDTLQKMADEEFNPNSPKQIAEILFTKFNLPIIKKTKTGASTDVDVLKKLSVLHPFPEKLLKHRLLSKIKSTYSDSLPQMVNSVSNRVHTTFLQTGTQTGRLSSKEPNLQNIPVKTEIGRKIRKAFIPSPGNILISADYSQIELFLLAEFSRDTNLFEAFKNGEDIHNKTASLIFGKNINDVTKEERSIAKTVNFGVLYGQSGFALSEDLDIPKKDGDMFIRLYFEKYSGVRKYMEEIKERCKATGYATTYWGRKRSVPEINSSNKRDAAYGERIAVNTTIQGSAADLIKIAMIRIIKEFKNRNLNSKLILQVHDELIFDTDKNEKNFVYNIIKDKMENGFDFALKLKTSIEVGDNWGEFH